MAESKTPASLEGIPSKGASAAAGKLGRYVFVHALIASPVCSIPVCCASESPFQGRRECTNDEKEQIQDCRQRNVVRGDTIFAKATALAGGRRNGTLRLALPACLMRHSHNIRTLPALRCVSSFPTSTARFVQIQTKALASCLWCVYAACFLCSECLCLMIVLRLPLVERSAFK